MTSHKTLKKKVIFNMLQSSVRGGMENVFLDYSLILQKNDFDVICLNPDNFPDNEILNKNKIKRVNFKINGHFDIFAAVKLFFLIKKHKPDLIIAHNGRGFSVLNILKFFGLKTTILAISHGGSVKRILKFDSIISVARHIEEKILKKGYKGNLKTIYNAIKVNREAKEHKNFQGDIFNFGVLSRLSEEKNIDLVIKSFARFCAKVNSKSYLIIGGEGEKELELKNLVKKLNIEKNVKFIGWIRDKKFFFNQINILIQATKNEALGITILESFNHHCPVIASNCGGPKEIINHQKNGFLFKSSDENSLFLEMKKAYENKDNLENITKNAFDDLNNKFSYEIMANSLVEFVKKIFTSKY